MRVVLYSPQGGVLSEALALHQRVEQAGIVVTECAVGQSLSVVLGTLDRGDELVVGSLDCFASLNELLGFVFSRGVSIRSLSEPWFSDPIDDPLVYQGLLYGLSSSLHAARTHRGLVKAALEGRHPGRRFGSVKARSESDILQVSQVDLLRREQGLSVIEACRQVGVSNYKYYQKRK